MVSHTSEGAHNARISMSVTVIVIIFTFGGSTVITLSPSSECIMVILTNKVTLTIIVSRQGDVLLFPGPLRKCHKARGNPFPRLKLTENRNRLQTFEILKGKSRTFPRHPRSRRARKRPVRLILVLLFRGRWAMRSGGSPLLTVHLL